jgi:hypothetical protein
MLIQCVLDCLLKVSVLLGGVTLVDLAWRQASADLSHRLWRWTCVIALILPLGSLMHPQHRLPIVLGDMIVFGSRMNTPSAMDAAKLGYMSNSSRDSKPISGQVSDLVVLGLRDSDSSRPLESDSNLTNLPQTFLKQHLRSHPIRKPQYRHLKGSRFGFRWINYPYISL